MELTEIERHAKALMVAHGVGSLPFEFDRAKRRIGGTHFIQIGETILPTKITLSKHWAAILSEEEIRDTILHEIAHALAGKNANHGPQWRAIARKVGARPERCKAPGGVAVEKSITANCPKCGEQAAAQHRLPTVLWVCKSHRRNQLTWFRDGVKIDLSDMPAKYIARVENARKRGALDD